MYLNSNLWTFVWSIILNPFHLGSFKTWGSLKICWSMEIPLFYTWTCIIWTFLVLKIVFGLDRYVMKTNQNVKMLQCKDFRMWLVWSGGWFIKVNTSIMILHVQCSNQNEIKFILIICLLFKIIKAVLSW